MKTIQLYRSLDVRIDHSLVNHILENVSDQDWSQPEDVFEEALIHLKEHEIDDVTFYLTTSYILMVLAEIKEGKESNWKKYMNALSMTASELIH